MFWSGIPDIWISPGIQYTVNIWQIVFIHHREDGKYLPDIGYTNNYFGNWAGAYRETQKGVGETEWGGANIEKN